MPRLVDLEVSDLGGGEQSRGRHLALEGAHSRAGGLEAVLAAQQRAESAETLGGTSQLLAVGRLREGLRGDPSEQLAKLSEGELAQVLGLLGQHDLGAGGELGLREAQRQRKEAEVGEEHPHLERRDRAVRGRRRSRRCHRRHLRHFRPSGGVGVGVSVPRRCRVAAARLSRPLLGTRQHIGRVKHGAPDRERVAACNT
eukprot:scaffold65577_cov66-Phaeocystis_antarctica.AAC.7